MGATLPKFLNKDGTLKKDDRDLVAPVGPDGRPRHVISIDETPVPRYQTQLSLFSKIKITKGKY